MRRFKMISGLLAVALAAVALAASASPAGATAPQAYYKKIQHQWELELKALGGNEEKAKMHHLKYHTLIKQYRQRVAQAEQSAVPPAGGPVAVGT
jgi:hypothetical protein